MGEANRLDNSDCSALHGAMRRQIMRPFPATVKKVYRASTYCTGDIAPAVLVKELCGLSQTVRLSAGNSGTLLLL